MSEKQNNTMIGFLAGAAIGAGLALLFAPAPGVETRRQIGEKARGLGTGAKHKLDSMKHAITEGTHGLKAAVNEGRDVYRRETEGALAHTNTS